MALRKLVEWDGTNYFGFVNIGCDLDSHDIPLAKEALVFIITAINDTWKIPVGYFFINSITAQQKAILVLQCVSLLAETGANIVTLTFDGAATNKAMSSHLGCDLLNYFFIQNDHKIYMWPDPCHNIKLIRNTFGDKKVLIDHQGNKISWFYIILLHKIQNNEGLHLGTKIKKDHIEYVKQKMKVRLATQFLSASVADALEFCRDIGIPEFLGCDGTIQFIRIFNNLFDIMNSRNMRAKGRKRALAKFNVEETKNFFENVEVYIKHLKFLDGTLVIDSNRSTGFRGFIVCMKSLFALYNTLIAQENSTLNYICTYKLCQDHLELFFGSIRAKCGFNNNPSACMFRAAYKRLLVHAQFKDSATGNGLQLEKITILNASAINSTTGNSRLVESPDDITMNLENLDDHDYIFPTLTEYAHHVVEYIAGFVVRKLKKTITLRNMYPEHVRKYSK
ncbi:hypothetical protein O3G_MSEX002540 [Manduca sexta]|uniref:THAP domain-containing protein 9 n=1 Tax=Manduca sexta TaxID=7130 RepID=A0A921YNT2_MANSE|nr:hypothetical protein O3G_MSEX002540 [Manduca sexta]